MAHELRNLLLPMNLALEKVERGVTNTPAAEKTTAARAALRQGLDRANAYVDSALQAASPMGEIAEPFQVDVALKDAWVSLPDVHAACEFRIRPAGSQVVLRAIRKRFVMAVANLLRNAVQHEALGVTRILVEVDATWLLQFGVS